MASSESTHSVAASTEQAPNPIDGTAAGSADSKKIRQPATRDTLTPSLGAQPDDRGVTFAVWAPGVDSVGVIGDFNDWNSNGYPLTKTDDDVWTGHLAGSKHGDHYVYELTANGETFTRLDPCGTVIDPNSASSVVHDHDTYVWNDHDFTPPTRDRLVVYRAPLAHWFRGDTLDSALLEQVSQLGFTAINVMCSRDEPAGPGYDPGSIYASDASFGGPHAFKEFIDTAHGKGLAVVLDVDYSHLGPFDIDVWEFCGPVADEFGGPYFFSGARAMTPWGDTRPDYDHDMVRSFLVNNALMWLRDYHLDGLNLAHVPYVVHETGANPAGDDFASGRLDTGWQLLQEVAAQVRAQFPHAVVIGDTWHHHGSLTDTSADGAGLHAQTDAEFTERILGAVWAEFPSSEAPLDALAEALSRCDHGEALSRVVGVGASLGSSLAWQAPEGQPEDESVTVRKALVAESLTVCAPGVTLMRAHRTLPPGAALGRQPLAKWPESPAIDQHRRFVSDLIALRTQATTAPLPARHLQPYHVNNDGGVLVCQMWQSHGPDDDAVLVTNVSDVDYPSYFAGLPASGRWELVFTCAREEYGYGRSDFCRPGDVHSTGSGMHSLDDSAEFVVPAQSVSLYVWRG